MPRLNKWERQHLKNLLSYQAMIEEVYNTAAREAAAIGVSIHKINPDRAFSFADYPSTARRIETLLESLKLGLQAVIVNGVRSEWTLANNKNNELCNQVFGDKVKKLPKAAYKRYYSSNPEALEAFTKRKVAGLRLSDRVWNYTNQFKEEIEMGLDVGIRDGLSADEMSRQLRTFLKYPDKLFRRVRDKDGNLQLSKRAAAFHPGQGVYRSSYKNARRLAATETNIAYRTADYMRWQDLDFVVGILIEPSKTNHEPDICDDLKGRYPKDFKWTGWHPHCRCHALTIQKTKEEMARDTKRILQGEEPLTESVNTVKDVPQDFNDWLDKNKERAKRSTSVPYFISDNKKYLPKGYMTLYALKTPYETYAEYEVAMRYNKKHADFTPEVLKNIRDLDQTLPVMQGKIMNFTEADELKGNPHFSDPDAEAEGYMTNCQTCTMTYELRRRGFPVEALPNKDNEFYKVWCPKNKVTWHDRFLNPDGTRPTKTRSYNIKDTIKDKEAFIEDASKETGRYEVYMAWKGGKGGAHVFIVERQKDGNLLWFDPQSGKHGASKVFNGFLKKARPVGISVLRIDDKIINPKFSERFRKASK